MREKAQYGMMQEIEERWSPRAFDGRDIMEAELMGLLEAASFAPSCMNEQPWRFVVARTRAEKDRFLTILTPKNQSWAAQASAYLLILSTKTFARGGTENRWHQFDAGTAWGMLSVEAQHRGMITHAMGGFDVKKARELYSIPEEFSVIACVAIGWYGDKASLSEDLQLREEPSPRKSVAELIFEG
jgi:nitroreductase